MKKATAYPLYWPDSIPRCKRPATSRFSTSLSKSLKNVSKSLELFAADSKYKVENIVVSSNVTLGEQRPKDAGVVVYFSWNGLSTCIPIDRYLKCEENLQAIHLCIEAERVKLRHGGINLVTAGFRGNASLPPPTKDNKSWWNVLLVDQTSDKESVYQAYKKLRSFHHPDKPSGDANKFREVQEAWAQAQQEFS